MKHESFWEGQAVAHLVAFGSHRRTELGRRLCAKALREARARGRERAEWLHRHLRFITGEFPRKSSVLAS
jgi:hypothetical protein